MVSFMVMNHLRKGLNQKICSQGIVGEPGLDRGFGQFALADPDGKVSCNSIPWLTIDNVANTAYFTQAIKRVGLGYLSEADNKNAQQYAAIMAHAMRNRGKALKVILVGVDFSWMKQAIDTTHLAATTHLILVDDNGTMIAGTENLANRVGKSLVGTRFYKQVLTAKSSFFEGSSLFGAESLIVTHQFRSGSGKMRVIIDTPYSELLKPAYRGLINQLQISVVVFVLILILAYYLSDRSFLRKVGAIKHEAELLAGGDLSVRINMANKDELGHLAQSIDTMANALQAGEIKLKAANDKLHRVNRTLLVLSAGNRSLLVAKTETELLDRICQEIVEKGKYMAAWIGLAGPANDMYLHKVAHYPQSDDEIGRIDWNEMGNASGPIIASVREDKVLIINDTAYESVYRQLGEQAQKYGFRSVIMLPLHLGGTPFGALILSAHLRNEFGKEQVEYLKETASDISLGIEMLRTKDEKNRLLLLEEQHEKIVRQSLEDAMQAISTMIEMRDPLTSGHQKRVAGLARLLARELGMSVDEAHGIFLAAIVHDIGKIKVPAAILSKSGKLSDMEFSLVKEHVVVGYELLKDIKFPWPIAEMVHQHHERLDGSGYPLGLKDGAILFGARILAVADVVEAMASPRPNRPALGIDAALNEINNGKSALYDEAVVNACIAIFREGRFVF